MGVAVGVAERVKVRWRILAEHIETIVTLGLTEGARYAGNYFLGRLAPRSASLRLPGQPHPLWARFHTSDIRVVHQVFTRQEYACVADIDAPRLIVDCGANVGYSSAWFAAHFPGASVVAIEPDDANVAVCRQNLAPFGNRVTVIQAAVWPERGELKIEHGTYRDGAAWATQVRACRTGEAADVEAIDLATVVEHSGHGAIDILKVDIERGEIELFGRGTDAWLSRVRNIVIELHDEECERCVLTALAPFDYGRGRSGELTVFRDLRRRMAPLSTSLTRRSKSATTSDADFVSTPTPKPLL